MIPFAEIRESERADFPWSTCASMHIFHIRDGGMFNPATGDEDMAERL